MGVGEGAKRRRSLTWLPMATALTAWTDRCVSGKEDGARHTSATHGGAKEGLDQHFLIPQAGAGLGSGTEREWGCDVIFRCVVRVLRTAREEGEDRVQALIRRSDRRGPHRVQAVQQNLDQKLTDIVRTSLRHIRISVLRSRKPSVAGLVEVCPSPGKRGTHPGW